MLKVFIKTYGCKVNQYESQLLRENFEKSGYQLSNIADSDIFVVNTCCVTEKAEVEAEKFVRKKIKEGKKVWVCGCGVKKGNKFTLIPKVEIFDDKNILNEKLAGLSKITQFYNRTRAFVKIEDGCENFCAYCIIPYVRGPVKSRKEEDIFEEVQNLADNGYKEIILTGIDIGAYGKDTGSNFITLLKLISSVEGIRRIRISSIEMVHLNEKFIEYLSSNKLICPHLHIPLQSGSDKVLEMMGRKYTLSEYEKKLNFIKDKIKNIVFTTDVMVGFPGEKEVDFDLTCETIKKMEFLKVHTFRYSKRKETRAYSFDEHIPEEIKKRRERVLSKISKDVGLKRRKKFIGSQLEVLVEKKEGEFFFGYSSNYIPLLFLSQEKDLENKIIKVTPVKVQNGKLLCVVGNEVK